MKNYNVYEQRFPLKADYKDAKGNQVWLANLVLMGQIRAEFGRCPIEQAKERFKVRHPVLHELDHNGDEVWRRTS